jgi:hypothetical protein
MFIFVIASVIISILIRRYAIHENKNRIEAILEASDERREKIFYFSREEIHEIKKMKKIVFFDNYIVDVEKFISYHPGGTFHIEQNLGNDVTRYLSGSMAVNKSFERHFHSLSAHKYLIGSLVVGVFRENSGIIITTDSKDCVVAPSAKAELLGMQFFDLPVVWVSSRIINVHVSEIRFTLKRNLQNYRFNRFLPGYTWTGRQYSVSCHIIKTGF